MRVFWKTFSNVPGEVLQVKAFGWLYLSVYFTYCKNRAIFAASGTQIPKADAGY